MCTLYAAASRDIVRLYVTPRLLYGLNATMLLSAQFKQLDNYHKNLLRQIQSLPSNTATVMIYLMLGVLPLEAQLDMAYLALFGAISRLDADNPLRQIGIRQMALKERHSKSWFRRVLDIGDKYGLDLQPIILHPWPKLSWKAHVKLLVTQLWLRNMAEEAETRSTLSWLLIHECWLGRIHPL